MRNHTSLRCEPMTVPPFAAAQRVTIDAARRWRRARRCARARRARPRPGAAPASPRSWCTSSTTWPSADAPSGSPFDSSPPLGFTGRRPPIVVAPDASSFACSPGAQRPSSWYASSSRAASVSWHSTTSTSPGPMPASSYASSRRERRRRRDVGVVDAGQRRGLAEHAAREVRAQPGRGERHRPRLASAARRRTIAAAPSFGEHSIQRCSGSHTTRDASTSSTRDLLAEHRVRVVHAVAAVLHDDVGEVLLREPRLAQQPLRAQREVRRRRREPGLLAPRLEERRADDALGHLLDAEHEHAVVLAGADRARPRVAAPRRRSRSRPRRRRSACRCARARRAPCGPTRRRRTRCRRTRPGTAGRPASASAARTACTPISVFVTPSKRPNGWMPTPAIATGVLMRSRTPTSRLTRVVAGSVVGDERHRLAELEPRGIGFASAA